jgi:hypothetical protein
VIVSRELQVPAGPEADHCASEHSVLVQWNRRSRLSPCVDVCARRFLHPLHGGAAMTQVHELVTEEQSEEFARDVRL